MVDEYASLHHLFHLFLNGSDSSMVDEYLEVNPDAYIRFLRSDSSMVDEYRIGRLFYCGGGEFRFLYGRWIQADASQGQEKTWGSDSSMVDEYTAK